MGWGHQLGRVAMGSGDADADEAPKGDLASRLKNKGLQLPSEVPSLSHTSASASLSGGLGFSVNSASSSRGSKARGGAAASGRGAGAVGSAAAPPGVPEHHMLSVSEAEKRQLFTPLAQQGTGAIEEERRRKAEGEKDRLKEVKSTLKRWVQECLAREEKRKKLQEKGILKCRVQAKWSEGLHESLKQLIAGYKGKLSADCEKENNGGTPGKPGEKYPSWLPRNERWLVGFDAAAFEAFMVAHPEVVEPPEPKVRLFVEEFVASDARVDKARLKQLCEALEAQFGPLRQPLLDRAQALAEDAVALRTKKGTKRKEAASEKEQAAGAKRPKAEAPKIETLQDAAWAASALAPMGLGGEGGSSSPVVRVPAVVAVPVLEGLRSLEGVSIFHEALRSTPVGKVVNSYRHHPSAEVAAVAKDLVTSWKAACKGVAAK